MFLGSILTIFDFARNCHCRNCFIFEFTAIEWNIIILYNVLSYFKTKNLIYVNIYGFDIWFSMNCDEYHVCKSVIIIKIKIHAKTMTIAHMFVVYFVENANVFLNESKSDCNYGRPCNAADKIFDTNYATKQFDSKVDIDHDYIDISDALDTKHTNDEIYIANGIIDGMKHNCSKISINNDNLAHIVLTFDMVAIILINNSCNNKTLWYMLCDVCQLCCKLKFLFLLIMHDVRMNDTITIQIFLYYCHLIWKILFGELTFYRHQIQYNKKIKKIKN